MMLHHVGMVTDRSFNEARGDEATMAEMREAYRRPWHGYFVDMMNVATAQRRRVYGDEIPLASYLYLWTLYYRSKVLCQRKAKQ